MTRPMFIQVFIDLTVAVKVFMSALTKCVRSHITSPAFSSHSPSVQENTVMIISFRTYRPGQTVQTQIRLLLQKQSNQGLHCLLFLLHLFGKIPKGFVSLFNFRLITANISDVQKFRNFTVESYSCNHLHKNCTTHNFRTTKRVVITKSKTDFI